MRVFSIVGEALNFGGRRLGLIIQVAWLPVVLLVILNMATVFVYLSILVGRVITFADVGTFIAARQALARLAVQGWEAHTIEMMAVTGLSIFLQLILISTFMAPLIRYVGLGERPPYRFLNLAFGANQVRYLIAGALSFFLVGSIILLPIGLATYYVINYIIAAASQTFAVFPDANSIHTIELLAASDIPAIAGTVNTNGNTSSIVAPIISSLIFWLVLFFHFGQAGANDLIVKRNVLARGVATFIGSAVILLLIYWGVDGIIASLIKDIEHFTKPLAVASTWLIAVVLALAGYFGFRLFPYVGVAVCRNSLAFSGTFGVTRGWNLARLIAVLLVLMILIFIVQAVIVDFLFLSVFIPWVVSVLFQAVSVTTRLVNSGVTGEWVLPLFIWIWNSVKIALALLVTFFSYGILAGLYGRLYRESETLE